MRTNYIFFCLLLGCSLLARAEAPVPTAAEPADELSLQEALDLALNANPEIAVALREREAIEGMQVQAATRPNPTLTARVEDTRSATRESFLEISQPIELGNKRAMRMEAAESYYDAASAAIALKKAEIQANVMAAFYSVLAAQERLRLAESSLDLARRAREAVSKQVEAGKVSPVQETRSKIAESGVRIELAQAKSALAIARKQLASLWGNPYPSFSSAQGSVETISALPPLEQLYQQLDQAPALLQAKLEVDTRQALVDVEKTKATPDIAVTLGTKHNSQIDNQAVIGLAIPLMVFDQNQGNIHEALSRVDKARAEVTALRIQLQAALARAYEQLQAARVTAESYEKAILPGARSAFEAARKGFEFGKFDFLELLDAERTLIQARTQYIDAMLQGHQAVADIKRILGDAVNTQIAPLQEP
jgi:cobalt-zinc-cadmium efflux system outer membrane protein